ncbi:MAG TPA: dienelactone hydrolase family protein [Actinomycetota bacterium]|nr:dienelactone hydrolase family protein [Actinomycetota bacterium]
MRLHRGQPVLTAGEDLGAARAAVVMVHGRGATAGSILTLAPRLDIPGVAFLAPQAAGGTWYPGRFLDPVEANEPWLSSALGSVGDVMADVEGAGIAPEATLLLGFSQGACLALEFVARNARRYGGVAGLSGGLIGPESWRRPSTGLLAGTPVFLGCADPDPHIPAQRVRAAADELRRLGGEVTVRLYPGGEHAVSSDELETVAGMLGNLVPAL